MRFGSALALGRKAAISISILIYVTLFTSDLARVAAQTPAPRTGTAVDALAGVHEVPLAAANLEGFNTRLGVGYGWTEDVLDMDDSHHRLQLDAALSATPAPWFSAWLRGLGRYDTHSGGVDDSGLITETHLGARATFPLSTDFRAGAELALWLPAGDTVGHAFSALSGDAQLLLAYAPELSAITLGLALGLRVDRSKHAGGDPERYSAADRLALGVSDSTLAARQGLAFSYRAGSVEWIAEWAWRMYLDNIAESPMWIRAGARYWPAARLQLELLLGVSPSKRPSLDEDAPLAVIEPRLAATFSATYAWPAQDAPPPSAAGSDRQAPNIELARLQPAKVSGQIFAPSGAALAGATAKLSQGENTRTLTTQADGAFSFIELPAGVYTLTVTADGFAADQRTLDLHDGDTTELRVELKRELPQGQIRGTVRRFNGNPIAASIAIAELGVTLETHADGSFEIDVPPGEYSVSVKARGFRSQTRKARVELRGVAILIVELEVAK